MKDAYM